MGYYRDPNKRADYYYDKAQKFFLDYGGENLRMFCTRERVSLRPLIIEGYRAEEISISIPKTHEPC